MATSLKKKSSKIHFLPNALNIKIGVLVSEWHPEVTEKLFLGAEKILLSSGIKQKNIIRRNTPGSYELPLAALQLLKQKCHAIVALGCVIKGETDHYDFICQSVSNGLMNVSLQTGKPVSFGLLTTHTLAQALNRAGGKLGNKGEDSAEAVLKML